MSQGVFDVLGHEIAGLGKGTKRGHIGKIPIPEPANIIRHRLTLQNIPGGLHNVARQVQAGSKIVGGACGDIADGGLQTGAQQPGDGFVHGAVTAAAYNQVNFPAPGFHRLGGAAGAGGHIGDNFISCLTEQQKNVG